MGFAKQGPSVQYPGKAGLDDSQVQPRMIIRRVHGDKTCPRSTQEASLQMTAQTNKVHGQAQA